MWLRLRTMWWSWPHLIICSVEQGRRGTHLSVSFRPLFSGPGFALEIRARIWWRSFIGNLSWSFKLRPLCFLGLLSMRQLAPVWASKFLLELVAFSFLARWIASWKLAATFVLGKCWFGWRGLIHNLLPCDVGWRFFFLVKGWRVYLVLISVLDFLGEVLILDSAGPLDFIWGVSPSDSTGSSFLLRREGFGPWVWERCVFSEVNLVGVAAEAVKFKTVTLEIA